MNTINSTNMTFGSTVIPINAKKPIINYFNAIKNCNPKSMQNMSVENCYRKLFSEANDLGHCQTGIMIDKDKNNNVVLRLLGYSKENDEYIYRQLKKVDSNIKYIKDIIDDGYDHGAFEILG